MSLEPKEDLVQNGRVKNLEALPPGNPVDFMFATDRPWDEIESDTVHTYDIFEDLTTDPLEGWITYAVCVAERHD